MESLVSICFAASDLPLLLLASGVVGLALAGAVWWLLQALRSETLQQGAEWRYDVSRINELRRQDIVFRTLQPVVMLLARINRNAFLGALHEIERQLLLAGFSRCWLPEEFLAKQQIVAGLLSPLFAVIGILWLGWSGLLWSIAAALFTLWLLRRGLARRAEHRLREIKRRLPFFLDLLTLLIEAGSSFLQALRQSVQEFDGHPISYEFGRVLADMKMGKARSEAFDELRNRLRDDEISAIVGAILQSEALGTPISEIFRTQADVLRVKRSQRAEQLAGEAGVNMLLPGMLVMAATVLLILGPFILNYAMFGMGL